MKNFSFQSDKEFTDNQKQEIEIPFSMFLESHEEIKWLRPDTYIRDTYLLEELIRNMPNKNYYRFKEKIKENYDKDVCILPSKNGEDFLGEDTFHINKSLYKEYFKFLDQELNIRVIDFVEEEHEIEVKQEDKKTKTKEPTKTNQKVMKSKLYPRNINMQKKYCRFSKWLASLFQVIKDLEIRDVNVRKHKLE